MGDAATGLTTVALVKEVAGVDESSSDSMIGNLIRQATDEIETGIGVKIVAASYTDVLDGSALGPLVLLHYPVIDFEELLSADGTTVVDATTYEVSLAAGLVEFVTDGVLSAWTTGTRNYTAVYTAGYETIPAGLEGIATEIVARRALAIVKQRVGTSSVSLGDGGQTTYEPREITVAEWAKLRSYRSRL